MFKENLLYRLIAIRDEIQNDIKAINERLSDYFQGSLFKQNDYYYIKRYEKGKTISFYLGKALSPNQLDDIKRELKNHKTLEKRKRELQKELKEVIKLIKRYEK